MLPSPEITENYFMHIYVFVLTLHVSMGFNPSTNDFCQYNLLYVDMKVIRTIQIINRF